MPNSELQRECAPSTCPPAAAPRPEPPPTTAPPPHSPAPHRPSVAGERSCRRGLGRGGTDILASVGIAARPGLAFDPRQHRVGQETFIVAMAGLEGRHDAMRGRSVSKGRSPSPSHRKRWAPPSPSGRGFRASALFVWERFYGDWRA